MKQNRFWRVGLVPLILIGILTVALTAHLNATRSELIAVREENTADAILASADISSDTAVSVPILYYDQIADDCGDYYGQSFRASARQFEWESCGFTGEAYETGLIEDILSSDFLPVATENGELLTNRGIDFSRWFSKIDGLSKNYGSTLVLNYDGENFSYSADEYYPLDSLSIPDEDVNNDGHNHLFTSILGLPLSIVADGNEEIVITADDDTFVYLNNDLILDLGGVHSTMTGIIKITSSGEIFSSTTKGDIFGYSDDIKYADYISTGLYVSAGESVTLRIFHADRNSRESVFKLKMSGVVPQITSSSIASSAETGVTEIAYNPEDPGYVAPLGATLTVEADIARILEAEAKVQLATIGILLVAFVLLAVYFAKTHFKSASRK